MYANSYLNKIKVFNICYSKRLSKIWLKVCMIIVTLERNGF